MKEQRALSVWEAAFVGFQLALGRAQSSPAIYFLAAIVATMAPGLETATRAAIMAGSAGLVVGSTIALVRRGRMVTRRAIVLVTLGACAGGLFARVANAPGQLATGLFVLGAGGVLGIIYHGALRRREAARLGKESRLGSVNAELERWTLPSFSIIGVLLAVVVYWASWREALLVVTIIVGANGIAAAWLWPGRPAAEQRPTDQEPFRQFVGRLWRRRDVRLQVVATAAATGAFAPYWFPLTLLIRDVGWAASASVWVAALGIVRFLARPAVRHFGALANRDPLHSARIAFRSSLLAPVVLAIAFGAQQLSWPPIVVIAIVGLGLLIAESTLNGGVAAIRTQTDHDPDQAPIAVATMLAGTVGVAVAGLAIARLDWLGSCAVGLALSLIAWGAASGRRVT